MLENLYMILATDKLGAIGNGNKLPWADKEEIRHFKKITTEENPNIIVSEKTLFSIPNKLKDRRKIFILTRDTSKINSLDEQYVYIGLEALLEYVKSHPDTDFITIGGKEIYRSLLPHAIGVVWSVGNFIADKANVYYTPDLGENEIIHEENLTNFTVYYILRK